VGAVGVPDWGNAAQSDGKMRIALVGPTAVGKTAVGIMLAERLGAEIISADSVQVYRRLDIGAAKPTAEERRQTRFHLMDVVDPDGEWTLADVQKAGDAAHDDIITRGRVPLIVGGTGLYARALTTRLDIPTVPPDEPFRERWRGFARERGNLALQAELARVDPVAAGRIHGNDVKRMIRALEVFAALGMPMSDLHAENQASAGTVPALVIALNYTDRRSLYARIEGRVDGMMAAGFEDEVRGLLAAGYSTELRSLQSLGYRHLCAYLTGACDLATAVGDLKRDTRHFARRQLIWFRGDPRVHWLFMDGKSLASVVDEATRIVKSEQL
jgi:tRNA dimethylallyltransferase